MASAPIERIIKAAVERGASDLHIKAGDLFRARIDGRLVPLTKQRLTPEQTRAIALKLMTTDEDRHRLDALKDYDCSWGMPGVGRFRVNILRQRSSFMIVMRVIPFAVPTLEQLGLPPVLAQLTEHRSGLVLVTGVTGSGKSSTIAAMLHHMNQNQQRHVVTIENPIEFLHRDLSCSMTQREVGVDTESVAVGLRAALRQDPDVVMVGDIRDQETLDTSMKAAETGHLVIGAMPTPDVMTTIGQVLSMLPREEREIGRVRFSEALLAIVSQQLLPRADGQGRVAAMEILVANPALRDCLKDPARIVEIRSLMTEGYGQSGMQTFPQHVQELADAGVISAETARAVVAAGEVERSSEREPRERGREKSRKGSRD
ncbi:MAG TPA: PilT/PilU family type 4a pilus ATPase [Gemmatimonadales bacterium]|nr:PilT/PilU family type 4a pilus ATPase [Gemmatimonadales bacterium]